MLQLNLKGDRQQPLQVLCLGAHSDDIEIGCGASVMRLLRDFPDVRFTWVVFTANGKRRSEAEASFEAYFSGDRRHSLRTNTFRNGFFPSEWPDIKEFFESLKGDASPDLIFTHYGQDLHQDHRVISELTWNTFRDHLVLEYEIPKYDGGLGSPSVFVASEGRDIDEKAKRLCEAFPSQAVKPWFTAETFSALARIRGIECNSPSGMAEAFYCRKLRLLA